MTVGEVIPTTPRLILRNERANAITEINETNEANPPRGKCGT